MSTGALFSFVSQLFKKKEKIEEYLEIIKTYLRDIIIFKYYPDKIIFKDLSNKISNASEKDTIKLIVNSRGGLVRTFTQLHNALMTTKAKTIAEIYAAYSAAGTIAFSCDEVVVKNFGALMIHEISAGN